MRHTASVLRIIAIPEEEIFPEEIKLANQTFSLTTKGQFQPNTHRYQIKSGPLSGKYEIHIHPKDKLIHLVTFGVEPKSPETTHLFMLLEKQFQYLRAKAYKIQTSDAKELI